MPLSSSNPLTTATSTPTVLPSSIIPSHLLGNYSVGRPPDVEPRPPNDPYECTIASSKLVLCGFNAYVERQVASGKDSGRVDLVCSFPLTSTIDALTLFHMQVRIPKVFDDPMESIKMDVIANKYPKILQQLFESGPTDSFFLAKCWANIAFDGAMDDRTALYAVDSYYESGLNFDIEVATKVCSCGSQVVEKVEVYSPISDQESAKNCDDQGEERKTATAPYRFKLEKSPMCEYMVG